MGGWRARRHALDLLRGDPQLFNAGFDPEPDPVADVVFAEVGIGVAQVDPGVPEALGGATQLLVVHAGCPVGRKMPGHAAGVR